jgi:hypothetical protein
MRCLDGDAESLTHCWAVGVPLPLMSQGRHLSHLDQLVDVGLPLCHCRRRGSCPRRVAQELPGGRQWPHGSRLRRGALLHNGRRHVWHMATGGLRRSCRTPGWMMLGRRWSRGCHLLPGNSSSAATVLDDVNHAVSKGADKSLSRSAPYLARQMSECGYSGRVAECTRPTPMN